MYRCNQKKILISKYLSLNSLRNHLSMTDSNLLKLASNWVLVLPSDSMKALEAASICSVMCAVRMFESRPWITLEKLSFNPNSTMKLSGNQVIRSLKKYAMVVDNLFNEAAANKNGDSKSKKNKKSRLPKIIYTF